jgi:hypothetical protein
MIAHYDLFHDKVTRTTSALEIFEAHQQVAGPLPPPALGG